MVQQRLHVLHTMTLPIEKLQNNLKQNSTRLYVIRRAKNEETTRARSESDGKVLVVFLHEYPMLMPRASAISLHYHAFAKW